MIKKWMILAVVMLMAVGGALYFNIGRSTTSPAPTITPSPTQTPVNKRAEFTIITGDITRSFKSDKYHNRSEEVFILPDNPSVVHVKKDGVTWGDFFNTLPMKLTKECLTTGDGENLCNTNGSLRFYLNDNETPDLLDRVIQDNDKLLIKFS